VTLTTWHPYPQKLVITSPTSGGRSVGIVRSRTQTMEFVVLFVLSFRSKCTLQKYALINFKLNTVSANHWLISVRRENSCTEAN
jgi:hypothetical protein